MQTSRKIKIIQFGIIGLCLIILISIPFVVDFAPTVARGLKVGKATSADIKTRELGLDYIIRHAGKDEKVRRAAVDLLSTTEDDENFQQIAKALDYAGLWSREHVPAAPYLRWLVLTAQRGEVKSRMLAVGLFSELVDIADDLVLQQALAQLTRDPDAEVRYNALVAVADLALAAKDPAPFVNMIRACANDPMPGLARQAWIMLGVLGAADKLPEAGLGKLPDSVAQAAAWALMASNAVGAEEAAQQVVLDEKAPITTRTGVVYALKQGKLPTTSAALLAVITSMQSPKPAAGDTAAQTAGLTPQPVTLENVWLFQRAVLSFSTRDQAADGVLARATAHLLSLHTQARVKAEPFWVPLFAAGYFMRSATLDPETIKQTSDAMVVQGLLMEPDFALAIFEGLPAGSSDARVTENMSEPMQLAVLRASKTVDVDTLFELCSSAKDTVRDQACVIAWKRLDKEQQGELVGRLLKDFNDNAKKSGGFLAGLTGTQTELLNKRVRDEDVWEVLQVLRLGQFMQKQVDYDPKTNNAETEKEFVNFRNLLMRSDLSRTTIVLGLLYKKDPSPLEFLLNPRGDPYLPLIDIFGTERWWMALQEFAPAGLPGIQRWADPGLIQFQIDLMRNWYLLHKRDVKWGK